MTLAVSYLPQARDDIDAAYLYYEQQCPGVGARFVSALQDQVSLIQKNPGSHGVIYQEIRAAVLRHFP
jgi:plasmid stabilization system protein ParE